MYNKVTLVGRLGKDPEQYNERSPVKFSLATDEKFTDKSGEKQERTEWHNIEVWGKLGDICMRFLRKGKLVLIDGSIKYGSYEKDGVKKYTTAINAFGMKMLSFDDQDERTGNRQPDSAKTPAADDDVPF